MLFLFFTLLFFSKVAGEMEFRICCESGKKTEKCEIFQNLSDMTGHACCSNQLYTTQDNLCCAGKVFKRDRGGGVMAHSCCAAQPLRLDQTCCDGVIHNIIAGDCCGDKVYSQRDAATICCARQLSTRTTPNDICCGVTAYDPTDNAKICCGDKISGFDACCQSNSGQYSGYNSTTHVCCDGPMLKQSSKLACCYLRKHETFIDTQYDKTKQCCKYPFDKLYPMPKSGSC